MLLNSREGVCGIVTAKSEVDLHPALLNGYAKQFREPLRRSNVLKPYLQIAGPAPGDRRPVSSLCRTGANSAEEARVEIAQPDIVRQIAATHAKGAATVAEAQAFMKKAEDQLEDLNVRASRAQWVQENFITDDTETMSAQANEKLTAMVTQLALDARRFDGLKLPPESGEKISVVEAVSHRASS